MLEGKVLYRSVIFKATVLATATFIIAWLYSCSYRLAIYTLIYNIYNYILIFLYTYTYTFICICINQLVVQIFFRNLTLGTVAYIGIETPSYFVITPEHHHSRNRLCRDVQLCSQVKMLAGIETSGHDHNHTWQATTTVNTWSCSSRQLITFSLIIIRRCAPEDCTVRQTLTKQYVVASKKSSWTLLYTC